jgi:hypothetical protein
VTGVVRLLTLVDVVERFGDARQMSLSARHEAVLADGRRILLLADRGWTESLMTFSQDVPDADSRRDELDIWAVTSVEDIEQTARTVVGPDEPFAGHSREKMAESHWAHLASVLAEQGVVADPSDLRRLPHDVELSERLLERVGRGRGGRSAPA